MGFMSGPMPLIKTLVQIGMSEYSKRRRKQKALEHLAKKPGRVQPYYPENSAYYQPTPATKKG